MAGSSGGGLLKQKLILVGKMRLLTQKVGSKLNGTQPCSWNQELCTCTRSMGFISAWTFPAKVSWGQSTVPMCQLQTLWAGPSLATRPAGILVPAVSSLSCSDAEIKMKDWKGIFTGWCFQFGWPEPMPYPCDAVHFISSGWWCEKKLAV